MSELKDVAGRSLVTRQEAVALLQAGYQSYTDLRQRNNWQDVIDCLTRAGIRDARGSAKKIQNGAHEWHKMLRERTKEKLVTQAPAIANMVRDFFDSREHQFQRAFEELLGAAGIRFTLFDDGTKPGAFDYLLHIDKRPDFIVECKTKQGDSLVDMNEVRTVLGAASQYGFDGSFCATLCNPGVNPDVLIGFSDCQRLAIAEAHEVAIALTRVILGKLSHQGFHDWINQPGLARAENIYAYSRSMDADGAPRANDDQETSGDGEEQVA